METNTTNIKKPLSVQEDRTEAASGISLHARALTRTCMALLLAAVLAAAGCSGMQEDIPGQGGGDIPQGSGVPIALSASELGEGGDVPSRALINQPSDLEGDGFVGWATWNYDTYSDKEVFGQKGTKVYYSEDGNSVKWDYSPTQYWQVGSYNFAAVLPASVFSASHKMDNDQTQQGPYTGEFRKDEKDNNNLKLFLDFGTNGFTLGGINQDKQTEQTDLMVAFTNKTVTIGQLQPEPETPPGPVQLNFSHALAMVNFTLTNTIEVKPTTGSSIKPEIVLQSVTLTGPSTTATTAQISAAQITSAISSTWELKGNEDYYYSGDFTKNEGGTQTIVSYDDDGPYPLISDLLVFPQNCSLTVTVTYMEQVNDTETAPITKTATLQNCTWEPGKKYTYPLQISQSEIIFINEPTVTEWVTVTEPAGNIVIK